MPQTFEDLNKHIVFTKVKSRSEALKIKEEAQEKSLQKNVVIFFENRYHLYLTPGYDPYQIRKEIENFKKNPTKDNESAIDESDESDEPETPKTKKSFFKK